MKKKIIIVLTASAIAAGALFSWHHDWVIKKDIIYLKNGNVVVADDAWSKEKRFYYKQGRRVTVLAREDIKSLNRNAFKKHATGASLFQDFLNQKKTVLVKFMEINDADAQNIIDVSASYVIKIIPWMLAAIIFGSFLTFISALAGRGRNTVKKSGEASARDSNTAFQPETVFEDASNPEKIALFFLNLFRIQVGAPDRASMEFYPAGEHASVDGTIYELRVRKEGQWKSRRMTISPLGLGTGSKSECFYVIYDVHMVVKIPPRPIRDFKLYIEEIRNERLIVDKLAPRECIIPRISVILKAIRLYGDEAELSLEKLEERYISWLTSHPDRQSCLKIGNTFVFFMDLSRYFFLGHIIKSLHDIKNKVEHEIIENSDILQPPQELDEKYGKKGGAICLKFQNIYKEYEREITNFFETMENPVEIQSFKIKEWFLTHLSGMKIESDSAINSNSYSPEILNSLIEKILASYNREIKSYRNIVTKYIAAKSFRRNIPKMSSISSNLLDLLAWMLEKKIAMRDLKPDNLLVAGDPASYPVFLAAFEKFSIGLIDVETAVDFETYGREDIKQPQIGGTPYYATPSHLFLNTILTETFDDLPRVFYLQDWHATIAIIYKVITGKTLFENTGKMLMTVRLKIKKAAGNKIPMSKVIKDISTSFWQSAAAEFEQNLNKDKAKLKSVSVSIPENVKEMLHREAAKNKKSFSLALRETIEAQTYFAGEKNRLKVLSASQTQIDKLQKSLENNAANSESNDKDNLSIINMLAVISTLKLRENQAAQSLSFMNGAVKNLSAFDLLTIMFGIVSAAMNKFEWKTAP